MANENGVAIATATGLVLQHPQNSSDTIDIKSACNSISFLLAESVQQNAAILAQQTTNSQITSAQQSSAATLSQQIARIAQYNATIGQLVVQGALQSSTIAQYNATIGQLVVQGALQSSTITQQSSGLSQSRTNISQLNATVDQLVAQVAQQSSTIAQQKSTLAQVVNSLASMASANAAGLLLALSQSQSQAATLSSSLAAQVSISNTASNTVTAYVSTTLGLSATVASLSSAVRATLSSVSSVTADNAGLSTTVGSLSTVVTTQISVQASAHAFLRAEISSARNLAVAAGCAAPCNVTVTSIAGPPYYSIACTCMIDFVAVGGGGGGGSLDGSIPGGSGASGAIIYGTFSMPSSTIFKVFVGGGGGGGQSGWNWGGGAGGTNGGGRGGNAGTTCCSGAGGGGGGWSGLQLAGSGLDFVIAGGGGGGGGSQEGPANDVPACGGGNTCRGTVSALQYVGNNGQDFGTGDGGGGGGGGGGHWGGVGQSLDSVNVGASGGGSYLGSLLTIFGNGVMVTGTSGRVATNSSDQTTLLPSISGRWWTPWLPSNCGQGGKVSTLYTLSDNGGPGVVILRYASQQVRAVGGTVTVSGDGYVYHTFTTNANEGLFVMRGF